MKRTIAYIDGYNLYYGLLKGTPWKWLDLGLLVKAMLRDDHDFLAIKYFTAPIRTYPHDAVALERQNVYLQALATDARVRIQLGYYSKNATCCQLMMSLVSPANFTIKARGCFAL